MNTSDTNEIGGAALELAECRKKLACLRTRADHFRQEISKAKAILDECGLIQPKEGTQSPSKQGWPSYDDIVEIYNNYGEITSRIKDLENRFRDWGVLPQEQGRQY